MKKILFLLLVITVIISCSPDEELNKLDEPVTADVITGTWKADDLYLLNGKIETSIAGIPTTADLDLKGLEYNATITLNNDPNTIVSEGDIKVKATISKVGFSISEEYQEPVVMTGTWSIADNVLYIVDGGSTQEFEIVEFTGDTIKFKQAFNEDFDNVSGYSGTAKGSLYIGFTKQ